MSRPDEDAWLRRVVAVTLVACVGIVVAGLLVLDVEEVPRKAHGVAEECEWVVMEVPLHMRNTATGRGAPAMCGFRVDKVCGGMVELTTAGAMPCLDEPVVTKED